MIMNHEKEIKNIAESLVSELSTRGLSLATAESCTGGAIAAAVTQVSGCSAVFKGSVVAYCNEVKARVLGVTPSTLAAHGAVSEETVREMVAGVCKVVGSDCGIATSGIAGPAGGSEEKPVGTVWVALSVCGKVKTRLLSLADEGRARNIEKTVKEALVLLSKTLAE